MFWNFSHFSWIATMTPKEYWNENLRKSISGIFGKKFMGTHYNALIQSWKLAKAENIRIVHCRTKSQIRTVLYAKTIFFSEVLDFFLRTGPKLQAFKVEISQNWSRLIKQTTVVFTKLIKPKWKISNSKIETKLFKVFLYIGTTKTLSKSYNSEKFTQKNSS